jgi:hypothetical protein
MGLRKSTLYVLGAVILCIVLLHLLSRPRPIEGFEEVIDCVSVPQVQYVRLYPSTLLPPAEQFLTLTQVRVLDEDGNNIAQGKPMRMQSGNSIINANGTVSPIRTGDQSSTYMASPITDGTDTSRYIGSDRSVTIPMAGVTNFIEINLGSPQTVSAVVYMGALDAPKQRNKGVKIVLLNAQKGFILGGDEVTQNEDIIQNVPFCKRRNRFVVTFVDPPADIAGKCKKQQFTPVKAGLAAGSQWLCDDKENAMKLFKGPKDKAKRYLRDGDQVCVMNIDGKKYSCFEPYDGSMPLTYYEADQTPFAAEGIGGEICGGAGQFIRDLSNSTIGINELSKMIGSVKDTTSNSEKELQALYTNMKCTTQTTGGLKTMCDSIKTSLDDIRLNGTTIAGLYTKVREPVDKIASSRASVLDLIDKYSCA